MELVFINIIFFSFRGPKKLLNTTSTAVKPKKGKKCQIKEENSHAIEINSLPTQSRRETRNSIKAAALHKHENSDKIIEDNKRKFTYVSCT